MIDRETLHPILARALAADQHDADERNLAWDPQAAASAVLDALEAVPTPQLLVAMGMLEAATRRDQERDFSAAHAEGLHDDLPREGCPECDNRGSAYRSTA